MAPKPLNSRQKEVLAWVAEGCPVGRWQDYTYKSTALALQGRGLIAVSKKGGTWSAALTPDGEHYVANGDYPAERYDKQINAHRRPQGVKRPAGSNRPPTTPTPQQGVTQAGSLPCVLPAAPTELQALWTRLNAAGGRLVVDSPPWTGRVRDTVSELNKESWLPAGTIVRTRSRGYNHDLLYIAPNPVAVVPRREVPVSERIGRLHPAVAAFRANTDHHGVSKESLGRASRILQAIAEVSEAAGFAVAAPMVSGHLREQPRHHLEVSADGFSTVVQILEKSLPGGGPVPYPSLYSSRSLPFWKLRRQTKFIPSGNLELKLSRYARYSSADTTVRDTKTQRIEDRLPRIVHRLEVMLFEYRESEREAAIEVEERERQWVVAVEEATERARAAKLAKAARLQASSYSEAVALREYADALEAQTEHDGEGGGEESWVADIRLQADERDPITNGTGGRPEITLSAEDLKPLLSGWASEYLRRL